MTTITSSFVTDIEDAILTRLAEAMGTGGIYASPAYLQVVSTLRPAGQPIPTVTEDEMPALWMEYIASSGVEPGIGSGGMAMGEETFTLFGMLVFTPGILEMTSRRDEQAFAKYALASADVFRARIVHLLTGWSPAIVDTVTGRKATSLVVDLSSVMPSRVSGLKLGYTAILRCRVGTEP